MTSVSSSSGHPGLGTQGSGEWSYLQAAQALPIERLEAIEAGISARWSERVLADLGFAKSASVRVLGLTLAGLSRRSSHGQHLPPAVSERVLGLARLIGQVQIMTQDAEGFDAAQWLGRWLLAPIPALGGRPPLGFLDTMEGQALVSRLLAQMESGAYA